MNITVYSYKVSINRNKYNMDLECQTNYRNMIPAFTKDTNKAMQQ